jgi:hypothetical protein
MFESYLGGPEALSSKQKLLMIEVSKNDSKSLSQKAFNEMFLLRANEYSCGNFHCNIHAFQVSPKIKCITFMSCVSSNHKKWSGKDMISLH